MSLPTQLLALLSAMFLAVFGANFITSVENVREYLQEESEIHAQDTATSLGLSLSHYIGEEQHPMLDTMMNTIFDSGYYQEMVLKDPDGAELIRKRNPTSSRAVPEWFKSLVPMKTATANTEISSGWQIGGSLAVTIHPGIAYQKLWEQVKSALYYSLTSFAVSLGVLYFILQYVLRPLTRIDRFAREIADGQFGTLDPLPWTLEMRNVATSMNLMSKKIGAMIANLNAKLESVSEQLRTDEVTGLDTRGTFVTDIKQTLMAREGGYAFIIHLDALGDVARSRGHDVADEFLREFAQSLRNVGERTDGADIKVYRFVGAEFAMLAEGLERDGADAFCDALVAAFSALGDSIGRVNVAQFGGIGFDALSTVPGIVAAATEAKEKARLIGPNSFSLSEYSEKSRNLEDWRELVAGVIKDRRFDVVMTARAHRLGVDGDEVVLEEAFTQVLDDAGEPVPIGTFVSVAEACGLVAELDLAVTEKVLDHLQADGVTHDVAVNVSFESLNDVDFRARLFERLRAAPALAKQLVFSVTAYAAHRDLDVFRSFIDFVHRSGSKVLLKRFETRFIPTDSLREYRLDYIRLARAYTDRVSAEPRQRQLVETVSEIGSLLDIRIVAEQVDDPRDRETLASIGLYAASD